MASEVRERSWPRPQLLIEAAVCPKADPQRGLVKVRLGSHHVHACGVSAFQNPNLEAPVPLRPEVPVGKAIADRS